MARISNEYKELLSGFHESNKGWAASGGRFYAPVCEFIKEHEPDSVLDYGAGKGVLYRQLKTFFPKKDVRAYDPAIPEYSKAPKKADAVICTDVMEHVEEACIHDVMTHLKSLVGQCAYFVIHTGHCGHYLPDGRPAHILQKPERWWVDMFKEYFKGYDVDTKPTGLPMRFTLTLVKSERI